MKFKVALVALLATLAALIPVPASAAGTLKVLAVGDSIISDQRWQPEFCRLVTVNTGKSCSVVNAAVGGSQYGLWISLISDLITQHQPDVVVLASGTNHSTYNDPVGQYWLGWSFRMTVETIHSHPLHPQMIPALIQYSDPVVAPYYGRQWVIDSQPVTNDVLYQNMLLYQPAGWFLGIADFQKIPGSAPYVQADGLHPTALGAYYMGRLIYEAAAGQPGWPPVTDPPLCDLSGHRIGSPRPASVSCPGTPS